MSRAERLLELLQLLRRHRYPVSGAALASELDVSLRTVYRDIASLQAQGAWIEGEPGLGFVLRPGFMLPPLMFSEEEIEALVLGTRWVARQSDSELAGSARNALAKISAVLPPDLRDSLEDSALLVGTTEPPKVAIDLAQVRRAIREQRKVTIQYVDLKEAETTRTIWPFAIGFFERARVIAAWCESREDFRHFRTDRVLSFTCLEETYPKTRQSLLYRWRELQNIPST